MRRIRWNRLAALCMVLVLALSLASPALAADTASGADLRLTATEGTVTLKNSSGKTLSVRDHMKLYSGYVLSTSAKSYAYVTLDSSKVVKLDANTKVELRKSGTKLELMVSSGKLFFNVKAPLSSGESLNIRTSTMVTGIRGTSGLVEVLDQETSAVSIYDGQVVVITLDTTAAGGFQTATVGAGQTGTSLPVGSDSWRVELERLTEEDIPGFVAVELAEDPELQQRVAEDTDLPVEEIVAGAQQRLEEDEKQAQEELDRIAGETESLPNKTSQDSQFAGPPASTGSSSGSTSTPSPDPDPDVGDTEGEPPATDFTIDGPVSGAQLQEYLTDYQTVTVGSGGSVSIAEGERVTIPADKTLTVADGGSFINSGSLLNNGSLTNNGTLTNKGVINNEGTLTNYKTYIGKSPIGSGTVAGIVLLPDSMEVDADGVYHIVSDTTGTIVQEGLSASGVQTSQFVVDAGVTVTIGSGETLSLGSGQSLTIASGAAVEIDGGTLSISYQGTFTNNGTVTNRGHISNEGNYTGKPFINDGGTSYGVLILPDSMRISADGNAHVITDIEATALKQVLYDNNTTFGIHIVVDSGVTVTIEDQSVPFSPGQTLMVESGASVIITDTGTLISYDTIVNQGSIENASYIYNYGTFTNSGTMANNGTLTNGAGAVFTNNGTYTGNAPTGGGTVSGLSASIP